MGYDLHRQDRDDDSRMRHTVPVTPDRQVRNIAAVPPNTCRRSTDGSAPAAPPDGSANIHGLDAVIADWPIWNAAGAAPVDHQVVSTMAFAPNTFWIGNDLVTCGGYDTATCPIL